MSSPHWKNYLSNLFQQTLEYILVATDSSVHLVYQTDSVCMFYRLVNTAGLSQETSHTSQNESTKVHKLAVQSEWDWCSGYGWLSSQRMWFYSRHRKGCNFLVVPLNGGLSLRFMCFDQHVKNLMPCGFPMTGSLLLDYHIHIWQLNKGELL